MDVAGMTVAEIRDIVQSDFNMPANATALIDGERVADTHRIEEGQELTFMKLAGTKGHYRIAA